MTTPEEAMANEALSAVRSGERARARDLLTRLLKTRQDNPDYWVWMSAVVDTSKERIYCLKEALRLDPQNTAAIRGLQVLGQRPADPSMAVPARYQRRNWQAKLDAQESESHGRARALTGRQFAVIGAAAVVVLGLVAFALFGMQQQFRKRYIRPVINLPTNTVVMAVASTPTVTQGTSGTPLPLASLLKATYTPTPLYINTPHSISEAFRLGQRAYQRGDWEKAITYFQQGSDIEPDAADILYNLGEAYRQKGSLEDAMEAYEKAIAKDPDFAPAYLGRASARLAQKPAQYDAIVKDLETALSKDPDLGQAYLALAAVQIQTQKIKDAFATLDQAARILPGSPLVPLYRARASLLSNDPRAALQQARAANALDITLLEAYLLMGQSMQETGDMTGSVEPLATYLRYAPEDGAAWLWMAKAQLAAGDGKAARASLDRSLALDVHTLSGYLLRGQLLLADGDAENALEDFQSAQKMDSSSFDASMGVARALMGLKYPGDAYQQIERSKKLAETDAQKAEWQFLRAQSLDALGHFEAALRDYQALVALPHGSMDEDWLQIARERISALVTKTPTSKPRTATPTPTKTSTRQPTATKKP